MMEQLHFFDWFGETEVQAAPRKKTEETPQKIRRRTQKKTESQAKIVPKKEASQKRTTVRKAAEESSLPSKENLDLAWKLCCLVCDIPYNKRSEEAPLLYGYSIANPKELAKDLDTPKRKELIEEGIQILHKGQENSDFLFPSICPTHEELLDLLKKERRKR